MDYLCTTPPLLLNTIENVLSLYDSSRGRGTMAGDAASLMNPEVGLESCILVWLRCPQAAQASVCCVGANRFVSAAAQTCTLLQAPLSAAARPRR